MARVFISSTFDDLQQYRQKIDLTLSRIGHEVISLESYSTKPEPTDIRSALASSDLYVGIFAWRYGVVPNENNPERLSIPEMEYREALNVGKPCLVFLLSEDAPWPTKLIDRDRTRIEALRSAVLKSSTVEFFRSPEDLAARVGFAIERWAQDRGQASSGRLIPEIDLTAYYAALRRRYRTLDLNALTPPQRDEHLRLQLNSVFVQQSVKENVPPIELPKELLEKIRRKQEIHSKDLPAGLKLEDLNVSRTYQEQASRPVFDVLNDPEYPHVVLLGNPGSGKSTLSRYLALSLVSSVGNESFGSSLRGYLPLLIELRSYAGFRAEKRAVTFLEFIGSLSQIEGWGLSKESLHHYIKAGGSTVVIFDGLDELFDPADRQQTAEQIVEFSKDYPAARIVVTSRVVGYRPKTLTDAGFAHFTLQDLDEQQVSAFVDRWYSFAMSDRPDEAITLRERILNSFRSSPSIQQLAGNPMLLTIMAIIGKHQQLPRERWKLYDHAADVLLQHWDVNKHLADRNVPAQRIGEEDKKELLRRLAYKMQGAEGGLSGNYISGDQLHAEFTSYLKDRYYKQNEDVAVKVAWVMIEQLRERNFILALYGADLYGFVHRAFLEFFCAAAFVTKFERTRDLTIDEMKSKVFGANWTNQTWHEVLRLICGMLNEKFAGELIDYLTNDVVTEAAAKRRDGLNLILAAQCLTEVRNLEILAEPAERLLEQICAHIDHVSTTKPKGLWWILPIHSAAAQFLRRLMPSVESIGPDWPNRQVLVRWLAAHGSFVLSRGGFLDFFDSTQFADLLGGLIGAVGAGNDEVYSILLNYLTRDDPSYRELIPSALAHGWRENPQTLPIIRQLADSDEAISVRRAAHRQIVDAFRYDAETLPLLREWSTHAVHEDTSVRSIAALAQHFPTNAETKLFIRELAVSSTQSSIRIASLRALGTHFAAHPETLQLLRERATVDENDAVRSAAIDSFATASQDKTELLSSLRDWGLNAGSPDVRREAISKLSQYFSDDPKTRDLLSERAVNDVDAGVRNTAVKALVQYYPDPETLSLLRSLASAAIPADEETRVLAISALDGNWSGVEETLRLLDSLTSNNQPAAIRKEATSSGLAIRKRRVNKWIEWLNSSLDESILSELPPAAVGFPAIKVTAVRLKNIKTFDDCGALYLSADKLKQIKPRSLTLLLGDNATGKSTWLRCIALAGLGTEMANQVEKRPASFLRHGAASGFIEVLFSLQLDEVSHPRALGVFCVGLEIRSGENSFRTMDEADLTLHEHNSANKLDLLRRRTDDRFGFICAYGAMRSLAENPSSLLPEEPKESHERVVSLFRSGAPLMDPEVLAKMISGDLSNFRNLGSKKLDEIVKQKMKEQLLLLLPDVAEIEQATASCMKLHGVSVSFKDLSDGYGSLLALVGHLLRQALAAKNWAGDPATIFGVVLIDEIDLHLHPAWQRRVLQDLQRVFPNVQIICTTHSPMIAGSVPVDSIVVLRRADQTLEVLTKDKLPNVKGWSADQILTSLLFELPTTRNVQTEELFLKYADSLRERGPDDVEVRQLGRRVSKAMDLGKGQTVDAYTHELLDQMLTERFKNLDEHTRKLVLAKAALTLTREETK
jgi:energy-coupling factor transporter ATP-binding protein EcfA2